MLGTLTKGPSDILVYTIDWSDWLNSGDSIATSTWSLTSGVTKVTDTSTASTTVIKVSGGTNGTSYTLTNTVTTTVSGETRIETFVLKVKTR